MSCILSLAIVRKWAALQRQHISQYTFNGVVKVWMADATSICREMVSHKEFFQSWGGDSLDDSFVTVIVTMVNKLKALSAEDASKIIDVLSNSPYGQKGTKTIKCAINAKVSAHNEQNCTCFVITPPGCMLHLACNKNGLGGWGGVGVVIYLVSGEFFPFVFVHSFYQHLRCIQCKLIAFFKKCLCQKATFVVI